MLGGLSGLMLGVGRRTRHLGGRFLGRGLLGLGHLLLFLVRRVRRRALKIENVTKQSF